MHGLCLTATLGHSSSPTVKRSWTLSFTLPIIRFAGGRESCILTCGILPMASFLQADIGSAHLRDSTALLRILGQGKTPSRSTPRPVLFRGQEVWPCDSLPLSL